MNSPERKFSQQKPGVPDRQTSIVFWKTELNFTVVGQANWALCLRPSLMSNFLKRTFYQPGAGIMMGKILHLI